MSTSLILKNTTSAPWKRFCFRTKAALRNQNKKTYSHFLITYVYFCVHGAHRACKIANKADQSCIFVGFGGSTRGFLQIFLSEPSRLLESLTLGRTTIAPEEQFCSGGAPSVSFGELKQTYVLFTLCLLFRIISTSAPHHSCNITNNPKVALRFRKSTRHLFPLLQCLLCDQRQLTKYFVSKM